MAVTFVCEYSREGTPKEFEEEGWCQVLIYGLTTTIYISNCPLLFLATDMKILEKLLSSPGIEPETFCNLCRCSDHWAMRLGQINREVKCALTRF